MKMSNEELVSIAENAIDSINIALSELDSVEEYKEIYEMLEEVKNKLNTEVEPYKEAYERECEEELEYQNREYERSVI